MDQNNTAPAQPSSRAADGGLPPAPHATLQSRTLRGTLLSVLCSGASQGLRLASNIVLSRVLFPEAFGLMALINMLITGLHLLSDVGLNLCIVQNERGEDQTFLDTVWTLSAIRGLLLWLLGVGLAYPFAALYGEPQLAQLVPVATLTAAIMGLGSTKLVGLHRRLALGRFLSIELASQVASIVAMVALAFVYRSVWALVGGLLVQASLHTFLSFVAVPGPGNRFAWDPQAAREIVSFGKWVLVSTLIMFLSMRLDVILLGKLIPLSMLGIYSMGIALTTIPSQLIGRVGDLALLPALSSSYRESRAKLAENFRRAQRVLLPSALFTVLGVALLAPAFFYLLYDERYHDAGWIAALATVDVWFSSLQTLYCRALLAAGDSRSLVWTNGSKLAVAIGGAVVGYHVAGIPGFILGATFGKLVGFVVVIGSLRRHGIRTGRLELLYSGVGVGLGALGGWLPRLVLRDLDAAWQLGVSLSVAVAVLLPMGLWSLQRVRYEIRGPRR